MLYRFLAIALLASPIAMPAQQEGPVATQTIVMLDSKTPQVPTPSNLIAKVNRRDSQITSISPVQPNGTQVALLIDDGLRTSVGRQLADIKSFINSLPAGAEIFIGYMQNGRVLAAQDFTTDHVAAAAKLRLPMGLAGISASPYFCLSDFVKRWPADSSEGGAVKPKARFVMMLTNGVDPYNGSVSLMNQNSPYVDNAIRDAQRAGVAVYSIYYGDSGIRGGRASFSGQNYLESVAQSTGGQAYFQGIGSPVSLTPFLKQFTNAMAESYVATFNAPANNNMVDLKFSTTLPRTKVQAPQMVRPGTLIAAKQ
jgi:hypothetical protein